MGYDNLDVLSMHASVGVHLVRGSRVPPACSVGIYAVVVHDQAWCECDIGSMLLTDHDLLIDHLSMHATLGVY